MTLTMSSVICRIPKLCLSVLQTRPYSKMIRLFEGHDHAKYYAQFRPRYPKEVYDTIISWAGGERQLAVDVACGSGQSTLPLAAHYQQVIGLDVSEAQLSQAQPVENITYRAGQAEDLGFLTSATVDLLTCAQGAHWLDIQRFYKQTDRVLKPGGTLCLYGYGNPVLTVPQANHLVDHFYSQTLGRYWASERKHIENAYSDFKLPYKESTRVDHLKINFQGSLDGFMGYLHSWSAYVNFMKEHPNSRVMEDLAVELSNVLPSADTGDEKTVSLYWPVFILLGKKPSQ